MINFNKAFNIIKKFESLINIINDFILFRYFKMFDIKKIVRKNENLKTQIVIIKNEKSMFLKINTTVFF